MAEKNIITISGSYETPLAAMSAISEVIPVVSGKIKIFDPVDFGFPAMPSTGKTTGTEISVKVKQICPGYPACGRKTAACEVSKTSSSFDPVDFVKHMLPPLPDPLPPIPDLSLKAVYIPFKIPSMGFPAFCPNSPKPPTPAEAAKVETFANNDKSAANGNG